MPPATSALAVPSRGKSVSPVRRSVEGAAVSADGLRRIPSRTVIRTAPPFDLLECPNAKSNRLAMILHLPGPLFVGGGTAEGIIKLKVDPKGSSKSKEPVYITRLSVDIFGVEEVSDGRRSIFLSLACELFDEGHPPPAAIVTSQASVSTSSTKWAMKPSSADIPFCLNLPLSLGPPSYLSKHARIRYVLCPTAYIQIGNHMGIVRQSWNVHMLTVHDPEKALASLPRPLVASDSLNVSVGQLSQAIKLTAGLHRQTWVSGSRLFVDAHVNNKSVRTVKRLEVQLEKTVLWYAHTAAGTAEKSASHLRLPEKRVSEIVATNVLKKGKQFQGIGENASDVRTIALDVPRSHVTISTGRFFEIRYFINIIAAVSIFKKITVQLPVTIIHMNSLDIVPNSLAQVAAAIEAKRARTVPTKEDFKLYPPYYQGQAFTAPRRQSLERLRNSTGRTGDVDSQQLVSLQRAVDESPRRIALRRSQSSAHLRNQSNSTQGTRPEASRDRNHGSQPTPLNVHNNLLSSHQHDHIDDPSCYHCQVLSAELEHHKRQQSNISDNGGPKLPRLQLSTSGLGFSESEFEVPSDSPLRKVMLSDSDRKMIHQERELRLARQRSIAHNRARFDKVGESPASAHQRPLDRPIPHERGNRSRYSQPANVTTPTGRSRSRTVPSFKATSRGPRHSLPPLPSQVSDPFEGRDLLPGDPEYWGWKNVAAVPISPNRTSKGSKTDGSSRAKDPPHHYFPLRKPDIESATEEISDVGKYFEAKRRASMEKRASMDRIRPGGLEGNLQRRVSLSDAERRGKGRGHGNWGGNGNGNGNGLGYEWGHWGKQGRKVLF